MAHRFRSFVLALAAAALLASPALAAEPFSAPDSVWNTKVGDNPAQESDASIAAAFKSAAHGTNWIQTDSYSTPIYRPGPSVALHPITLTSFRKNTPMQDWLNAGVPYLSTWQPAAGSDHHITIYQASTHRVWSCWDAANVGGALQAQTCQGSSDTTTDPGYSTDSSFLPWSSQGNEFNAGHNWTSTATSLAVVDGTMTLSQLRAASIGHALAVDTNNVCGSYYSFPAQQHDGGSNTGNCVPEGAHVYLPKSVVCSTLTPAVAATICRALKGYGGIVRDSTVSGIGLFAEDVAAKGQGDPYYHNENIFNSQYPSNFLSYANFPWSSIQVLPLHKCSNPGVPCTP